MELTSLHLSTHQANSNSSRYNIRVALAGGRWQMRPLCNSRVRMTMPCQWLKTSMVSSKTTWRAIHSMFLMTNVRRAIFLKTWMQTRCTNRCNSNEGRLTLQAITTLLALVATKAITIGRTWVGATRAHDKSNESFGTDLEASSSSRLPLTSSSKWTRVALQNQELCPGKLMHTSK